MKQTPDYQAFRRVFDPMVDEYPMNPTLIERDGKPDAFCVSAELLDMLMEKARLYDEAAACGTPDDDETSALKKLMES